MPAPLVPPELVHDRVEPTDLHECAEKESWGVRPAFFTGPLQKQVELDAVKISQEKAFLGVCEFFEK